MRPIAFLALLPLAACSVSAEDDVPAGGGASASRDFLLEGFDSVSLAGSDNVTVSTGKQFSVRATGDVATLDRLDIRVEGGALRVGRRRDAGFGFSGRAVQIAVSMPAMRAGAVAGSGDLSVDSVRGDEFDGSVAGSGDLSVARIEAATVKLSVAGSGDIRAAGRARETNLSIAGSGDIDAGALEADSTRVSVAGSGDARAGATRTARVSLVGSGDVEIVGSPQCEVSKRGSGDVRCVPGR